MLSDPPHLLELLIRVAVTAWSLLRRRFTSSLPSLTVLTSEQASGPERPVPVLVVGLGKNGDCIPRRSNYQMFYQAAAEGRDAPAALVVLKGVREEKGLHSFCITF